jgi:hypothetical protein
MWRRIRLAFALVLAVLAVVTAAGCGGDDEGSATGDGEAVTDTGGADTQTPEEGAGGDRNVNVTLDEQNGSGETGTATLSAMGDGKTRVVLQLSNPPKNPQPAHIHEGTCDKLNPTPAYPLNNLENGRSDTTVDVGLDKLQETAYAINVHKSEADIATYFACGNVAGGGE